MDRHDEPHRAAAGSDLALVRTRAEPQPDGSYKVFGTKIFITYGEHDMAENIVHLVLARVSGRPEGVKGISLSSCRSSCPYADGRRARATTSSGQHRTQARHQGEPDGVSCSSAMAWRRRRDTWSARKPRPRYMFIMMNAAAYAVGMQGIGCAERAYQQAAAFARERVQSRPSMVRCPAAVPSSTTPTSGRMLMTMRASTEGCRRDGAGGGRALRRGASTTRSPQRAQDQLLLLIHGAACEGYSTEMSIGVASPRRAGARRHGFIEETGAAQYSRDARILTIYEGHDGHPANRPRRAERLPATAVRGPPLADHRQTESRPTEAELSKRETVEAPAVAKRLGAARAAFEDVRALESWPSRPTRF
jgi:alkylation response protein AidB-like acyl-CoA dehydrogenase